MQKIKEVMGIFKRGTMSRDYRRFWSSIEVIVEAGGDLFERNCSQQTYLSLFFYIFQIWYFLTAPNYFSWRYKIFQIYLPHPVFYFTELYHTVYYCTLTVPHCTALYRTLLHCTAHYSTVPHCTTLYSTVPYCTVLYRTKPYCNAHVLSCKKLYCHVPKTVPYCTVLYRCILYCTSTPQQHIWAVS
jgi:hypothetical protein